MLFLQKLPKVGVFILMFNTIMRTFMRFVIVFTLFMLSFSMPFFLLLQNTVPFDSAGKSFVKSLIMMIGEFEYEVIFEFYPEDFCQERLNSIFLWAIEGGNQAIIVIYKDFMIQFFIHHLSRNRKARNLV